MLRGNHNMVGGDLRSRSSFLAIILNYSCWVVSHSPFYDPFFLNFSLLGVSKC